MALTSIPDIRRLMLRTALILGLVFGASVGVAQTGGVVPELTDRYVNDAGGVLSWTEKLIHQRLETLERETGVQIAVATIDSRRDFPKGASIEAIAAQMFSQGAAGEVARQDGVLIFIAAREREIWVELGSEYPKLRANEMRQIIDREMAAALSRGEFEPSVLNGVKAIAARFVIPAPTQVVAPLATPQTTPDGGRWSRVFLGLMTLLLVTIVAVPLVLSPTRRAINGLRNLRRSRSRSCPKCPGKMVRLSKATGAEFLDEIQRAETEGGVIEHDVFQCEICRHRAVIAFKRWFSNLEPCSNCGRYALTGNHQIMERATVIAAGRAKLTTQCRLCHHKTLQYRKLPRRFIGEQIDYWQFP